MLTNDSSGHKIVLRHTHQAELSGYQATIPWGVARFLVPHVCGCVSGFAPAGRTETGGDGIVRSVWRQVDFKFQEYEHGA